MAPTFFVVDLELLKNICVKDFEHFVDRGFYYNEKDDPIGCHLLAIDGDRWKYARKKASSIFTASRLKWMFHNIAESVDLLVEYMNKVVETGDQPVNIRDVVCKWLHSLFNNVKGSNYLTPFPEFNMIYIIGIICYKFRTKSHNTMLHISFHFQLLTLQTL